MFLLFLRLTTLTLLTYSLNLFSQEESPSLSSLQKIKKKIIFKSKEGSSEYFDAPIDFDKLLKEKFIFTSTEGGSESFNPPIDSLKNPTKDDDCSQATDEEDDDKYSPATRAYVLEFIKNANDALRKEHEEECSEELDANIERETAELERERQEELLRYSLEDIFEYAKTEGGSESFNPPIDSLKNPTKDDDCSQATDEEDDDKYSPATRAYVLEFIKNANDALRKEHEEECSEELDANIERATAELERERQEELLRYSLEDIFEYAKTEGGSESFNPPIDSLKNPTKDDDCSQATDEEDDDKYSPATRAYVLEFIKNANDALRKEHEEECSEELDANIERATAELERERQEELLRYSLEDISEYANKAFEAIVLIGNKLVSALEVKKEKVEKKEFYEFLLNKSFSQRAMDLKYNLKELSKTFLQKYTTYQYLYSSNKTKCEVLKPLFHMALLNAKNAFVDKSNAKLSFEATQALLLLILSAELISAISENQINKSSHNEDILFCVEYLKFLVEPKVSSRLENSLTFKNFPSAELASQYIPRIFKSKLDGILLKKNMKNSGFLNVFSEKRAAAKSLVWVKASQKEFIDKALNEENLSFESIVNLFFSTMPKSLKNSLFIQRENNLFNAFLSEKNFTSISSQI